MSLTSLGWNDRLTSLWHDLADPGLIAGRVVRVERGRLGVAAEGGELTAVLAGRLDPSGEDPPAAVGDWVAVAATVAATPVVRAILPRASRLARRAAGSERSAQLLAANVDLVLLVEPLDRGPNPRRIERGVALAWDAGATPLVVLTKADLATDLAAAVAAAAAAAPFADLVPVCAAAGDGLDQLRDRLGPGRTAVLLGPSGAGKSTLANALLGAERLATGAVRDADHRGRHTTTRRELVTLASGGCLIDTPGLREIGLWLAAEAVDSAFPEIEALAAECRFGDCGHQGEPGCAVAAAVERGELGAARLAGYHRLRREARRVEQLAAPRGAAAQRARDKSFARLVRAEVHRKQKG